MSNKPGRILELKEGKWKEVPIKDNVKKFNLKNELSYKEIQDIIRRVVK